MALREMSCREAADEYQVYYRLPNEEIGAANKSTDMGLRNWGMPT